MDTTTALLVVGAGLVGGTVNGVVGSGTLVTFPVLLAAGLPPVVANGTNTTGLSFGSATSAYGYRREMGGRRRFLVPPLVASFLCGAVGAALVLALPERVFVAVVPWLIGLAAVLVAVQPRVTAALQARRAHVPGTVAPHGVAPLTAAVGGCGVYGGYFGAAQGVILMAVLGVLYDADLQRSNGAKNLMAAGANVAAAIVFALAGRVDWLAAVLLAVGAFVGGSLGARLARRLPPGVMRAAVVAVGVVAALSLLVRR